jgi:hypothetical protein
MDVLTRIICSRAGLECALAHDSNRMRDADWAAGQVAQSCVVGDSLVAAALATYGGALPEPGRQQLVQQLVLGDLAAQKIPLSPLPAWASPLRVGYLVTPHEEAVLRAEWVGPGGAEAEGAGRGARWRDGAGETLSCAVTVQCVGWPVLVDPTGRGLEWLQRRYDRAGRVLHRACMHDAGLDRLAAQCAAAGEHLLIMGPLAPVAPGVLGLVQRRMRLRKRAVVLDPHSGLGAIPVAPGFRLFLHCGLGRAAVDPLLASLCTLVNLAAGAGSFHAAAVDAAVALDHPRPPRPAFLRPLPGAGASPEARRAGAGPAGSETAGAGAGKRAVEAAGAAVREEGWEEDEDEVQLHASVMEMEEVSVCG